MTVEEQRYLDECKKVLKQEQIEIVTMAMDYGLQIPEIRKLVQSNQSAECMKEIVFAMMEGISDDVLDFLCENEFNQYQIKEIREGIVHGLSFEQIRSYATKEMLLSRKLNDALSSRLFYAHFDSHRDISHFKSSCFCELFF